MLSRLIASLAIVLCCAFAPGLAQAQQAQGILAPDQVETNRGNLMMARGLLAYGNERKDAYSVLAAVRIMANVPGRILADGEAGPAGREVDLLAELDKAQTYASGNEALVKTIADMRTQMTPKLTTSTRAAEAKGCVWRYWCNCCNCWYQWACW
jgi:hypothetical protein